MESQPKATILVITVRLKQDANGNWIHFWGRVFTREVTNRCENLPQPEAISVCFTSVAYVNAVAGGGNKKGGIIRSNCIV
jgi:hypothetical protein